MKHDWDLKKFSECFDYIRNGANIKQVPGAGGIPITRIETLSGGVFNRNRLGYANIENVDRYESHVLTSGDLLLSHINSKSFIGRTVIYIKKGNEKIIHGMNLLRLKSIPLIISPFYFQYYSLTDKFKHQIASIRKDAVNQSSITVSDLKTIRIPVPSLSIQEKIVAELDCLSGVIEKKREQLKQLDALAQSIFYDMFGDPITNEKGWEVKKLGEVCEDKKKIFRASKKCALDDVINYIDISAIDNINNVINIPTPYIFEEAPSRAQQVVQLGDVIVSMVRPNLKNIAIVNCNYDNLIASSGFCVLRARKEITIPFLFYIVKSDAFTMYLMDRVSGANYPAVRESDITDYISIIPPITLQQEFAEKIEAIEKQKELIQDSIKETEALFNERLQYWFEN